MKQEMENVQQKMQTLSTKYGEQLCVLAEDISMVGLFWLIFCKNRQKSTMSLKIGVKIDNFNSRFRSNQLNYSSHYEAKPCIL